MAQYADACNINTFEPEAAAHKLVVLRQHCADLGRNYDEIEKTVQFRYDLGPKGENVSATLEHLHALAEAGYSQAHGSLRRVSDPGVLDMFAEQIIPAAAKF